MSSDAADAPSAAIPLPQPPPSQPRASGDAIINIDSGGHKAAVVTTSGHEETDHERKKRLSEERKAFEIELNDTLTISMNEFPAGYPLQAAFQSSDPSMSLYRAFDYLHSRVILELQDELRCLEEKLADLDQEDAGSTDLRQRLRVRSRDADMADAGTEPSPRSILLSTIRKKLVDYDEILVKARELTEFQRPSSRDYYNLRQWFWNEKPLSYEPEEDFIRRKGDLITLRPRAEWGKFDGWIQNRIQKMPKKMTTFFREPAPRVIPKDQHTRYYSAPRIGKLTTLIIAFVIIILLSVPVFLMYRVSWSGGRRMTFLNVGLLIIFTLIFSGTMSLLTRARRAELFAASAAYCAVLIVFIGNFSGGDSGVNDPNSLLTKST